MRDGDSAGKLKSWIWGIAASAAIAGLIALGVMSQPSTKPAPPNTNAAADSLPTSPPAAPARLVAQGCADPSSSYSRDLLRAGLARLADSLDAALVAPDQEIQFYIQAILAFPPGSYGPEAELLRGASHPRRLAPMPSVGPSPTPLPPPSNPIDVAGRKEAERLNKEAMDDWMKRRDNFINWVGHWTNEMQAARDDLQRETNKIRSLDPPVNDIGSDWAGCISQASERLQRSPGQKYFVIIGDTIPYQQQPLGASRFEGVRVLSVNLYCSEGYRAVRCAEEAGGT